jgi:hypothetical protein
MSKTHGDSWLDRLLAMPRFGPALVAAFLAGLMMLFLDELCLETRKFLVPSLVVYALGAALLGSTHRLVGIHYRDEEKHGKNTEKAIPRGWKRALLGFHVGWFALLILYNFLRGAL